MTRKKSFPAPSSQPAGRWSKRFVLIAACAAVVTVVGAIRHYWSAEPANAQMPGVGYQRGAGQSNSTRQPAQRPSQPAPAARSNSAQPDMVA
ncbi:MAG TPA: hypothetical protein VJL29_07860, partial [Thermoguttaceae bacterium]|nr:hypothetical protein [Thermoguttaceae bacterium]